MSRTGSVFSATLFSRVELENPENLVNLDHKVRKELQIQTMKKETRAPKETEVKKEPPDPKEKPERKAQRVRMVHPVHEENKDPPVLMARLDKKENPAALANQVCSLISITIYKTILSAFVCCNKTLVY